MPGSKKGRKFSPEARQRIAEAARNRKYAPGAKQKLAEQIKAQREDPEFEAKRVAALQERLTGTKCLEGCTCDKHSDLVRDAISRARTGVPLSEEHKAKIGEGSKAAWARKTPEERSQIALDRMASCKPSRVSRHEYALAPYMAELGFTHNDDAKIWVGRRVPDFVNEPAKTVYEYFGSYWHPRREEEEEVKEHYALKGWQCYVLWEDDLCAWLQARAHLVSDEQHAASWKIAVRGKKRPV